MKKGWLLGWGGALAGVPFVAAAYRRVSNRADKERPRQFIVRARVDPELVRDLVELVGRVRGRAALEAADSFSVPIPEGVPENAAYRELRALIEAWERGHPGVRTQILHEPETRA
jgi:hypothetical protein